MNILQNLKKQITFQWIPSHIGIEGNEQADTLAKKGTQITQLRAKPMTFHSSMLQIKHKINVKQAAEFKINCIGKQWNIILDNKNLLPDFPRRKAVALFRIVTGHDCLAAHLHRLNIFASPHCILCEKPDTIMNGDHLLQCQAIPKISGDIPTQLTKYYWDARRKMEIIQLSEH